MNTLHLDLPRDLTVAEASSVLNISTPMTYKLLAQGVPESYLGR